MEDQKKKSKSKNKKNSKNKMRWKCAACGEQNEKHRMKCWNCKQNKINSNIEMWEVIPQKVRIRDGMHGERIGVLRKGSCIKGEKKGNWLKHERGWSRISDIMGKPLLRQKSPIRRNRRKIKKTTKTSRSKSKRRTKTKGKTTTFTTNNLKSGGTLLTSVFLYGNIGQKQLQRHLKDKNLFTTPACALGWVRVFSGWSSKWRGAIPSMAECEGGLCLGSLIRVKRGQLKNFQKLQARENVYKKQDIYVDERQYDGTFRTVNAITYLKQCHTCWDADPSEKCLTACAKNISRHWGRTDIVIRRGDTKEIVKTWEYVPTTKTQLPPIVPPLLTPLIIYESIDYGQDTPELYNIPSAPRSSNIRYFRE